MVCPARCWHHGDVGSEEQTALATRLRLLHHADTPLILPNAWDAASARAVEGAGFTAVATTSGGVAASLGWPDGEQVPPDEMFAAIARIVRSVDVPVTADIEAGYGLSAVELVDRLIGSGAVGCNIEDTDHAQGHALVSTEIQAQRLGTVKEAAVAAGVDLVVNARIDVFLRQEGNENEVLEEAVGRAKRYVEAGADCVYPIGANEEQLAVFIDRFRGVVNGMVRPRMVRLSRLRALGLARISFGSIFERLAVAGFKERLEVIACGGDERDG
jgi:2-methylisocitrate lyase-like PEP mutase family enzyme